MKRAEIRSHLQYVASKREFGSTVHEISLLHRRFEEKAISREREISRLD